MFARVFIVNVVNSDALQTTHVHIIVKQYWDFMFHFDHTDIRVEKFMHVCPIYIHKQLDMTGCSWRKLEDIFEIGKKISTYNQTWARTIETFPFANNVTMILNYLEWVSCSKQAFCSWYSTKYYALIHFRKCFVS